MSDDVGGPAMSHPKDEPELPPEILKQIIQVDPERYQQMMDAPFQTHPSQLTWRNRLRWWWEAKMKKARRAILAWREDQR